MCWLHRRCVNAFGRAQVPDLDTLLTQEGRDDDRDRGRSLLPAHREEQRRRTRRNRIRTFVPQQLKDKIVKPVHLPGIRRVRTCHATADGPIFGRALHWHQECNLGTRQIVVGAGELRPQSGLTDRAGVASAVERLFPHRNVDHNGVPPDFDGSPDGVRQAPSGLHHAIASQPILVATKAVRIPIRAPP